MKVLDKGAACLDFYLGKITWQQYNRQIRGRVSQESEGTVGRRFWISQVGE